MHEPVREWLRQTRVQGLKKQMKSDWRIMY